MKTKLLITFVFILAVCGLGLYFIWKPSINPSSSTFQNPTKLPPAHNEFGFNILKTLHREEQNTNIFISPSSISLALSMVYSGARGETQKAMAEALQFQNLDTPTINEESLGLINILKNPDPKVELSIANSVWARKDKTFKGEFLEEIQTYYNAEISTLDFDDPEAVDTINAWVSKNTKDKIPTIVKSIPSDMVMYLINAVYFKGTWTSEFDKKLTVDKTFTPNFGAPKKHPLMQQTTKLPYFENAQFQSVALPYGENKRLSMYVFLPQNLSDFVENLNLNVWNDWMPHYKETEGTIFLPRFTMEYETELKAILTQLGMGIAFGGSADLTGIGENLTISEVKHKTYIDVNEEGTEAAAVTSIGIGVTSIGPSKKTFYMEVNRPFFFAIRDNETQEVLFMGTIQNP